MNHLKTHYNCQTAKQYIDINYLDKNGHVKKLLKSGDKDGRMILALLGILTSKSPKAYKKYLISQLDSKDKFKPSDKVADKLGGMASEDDILRKIGKLTVPIGKSTKSSLKPKKSKASSVVDANMKIEGDTNNKSYVNSVSYKGEVKNDKIKIYKKPDATSKDLATLAKGTKVNIFGSTGTWWAIEYTGASGISSAFISQTDVDLI